MSLLILGPDVVVIFMCKLRTCSGRLLLREPASASVSAAVRFHVEDSPLNKQLLKPSTPLFQQVPCATGPRQWPPRRAAAGDANGAATGDRRAAGDLVHPAASAPYRRATRQPTGSRRVSVRPAPAPASARPPHPPAPRRHALTCARPQRRYACLRLYA